MSWVTIDQEKCNECGICAKRCTRCFTNNDGVISVQADEDCCNLCGHCVALCTPSAITHHLMDMGNFPPLGHPVPLKADEFIRLVRQRRSYRTFREKVLPREDIEKLVAMSRYCPTGSNMQSVQIKLITNRERIKQLSDLTVEFFMEMIDQVDQKISELASGGKDIPKELSERKLYVDRYRRMGQAKDLGIDPILHNAPLVMIFHSPPNPSTPKDDCVIAAQTVVLGAMTLGLGTCYIGLLTNAALNSPRVYQTLDLPSGNTPYCVLVLGYPKLKFQRAIDRKPLTVQWEE
jgi:nitroreductase/NAD-dependent dihydropyrimidine dehydrogenase PreA subunit